MCGIVGSVGPRGSLGGVRLRLDRLRHRGPDGEGEACASLAWGDVRLGMTRLAIVSRAPHALPLWVDPDPTLVAFNGEIYNWRALRAELQDGSPWKTDTDTEVVLRAWRRWGPAMVELFNGAFAVAIADPLTGCFYLARDRAGKKPLYYSVRGGVLHFASEIKALPGPRREGLCLGLELLEYDFGRETPFEGIYALEPGQELLCHDLEEALAARPTTWWSLPAQEPVPFTREEAAEELEPLVRDAVQIRLPEVPAALLLSGGLDSSIIQAVAGLERLYTVTFPEDGLDFLPAARAAAGDRPIAAVTFGRRQLDEELPQIAWHLDTPATWTAVCQWFVDRQAAADGAKVVVSGEGADELFGGYTRYRYLWHLDCAAQDQRCAGYEGVLRSLVGDREDMLARLLDRSGGARLDVARLLVRRWALGRSLVEDAGRVEFYTGLQVQLRMADRMAAAFSMENRCPFLDHRIIAFASRLPVALKITERESKAVLRDVARRLGVPREIVDEPVKRGMTLPWPRWQPAQQSARGGWDRSAFAQQMRATWRQTCL